MSNGTIYVVNTEMHIEVAPELASIGVSKDKKLYLSLRVMVNYTTPKVYYGRVNSASSITSSITVGIPRPGCPVVC